MAQPISLCLIGGFLGAGKTTFLRQLLAGRSSSRVGVLVNEFGDVGIDGKLLYDSGVQLVEINNGSIFCACLKDGFVRTLEAFARQPVDVLLIEASGLADPGSISDLLERIAPCLARPYHYCGMVCLVDCTTFEAYADVLLPVQNQVAAADLILLNKTDLASERLVERTAKSVRELNGEAAMFRTSYAAVPLELLHSSLVSHGRSGGESNTPWNRPSVYTMKTGPLPSRAGPFKEFYRAVSPLLLRLKGALEFSGEALHVDGVCGQLELTPACPAEKTGIVVAIGRSQQDIWPEVQSAWQSLVGTPVTLASE